MSEQESPEPQQLHEFTQNLVSDLQSGAISAQEALTAANQYSFLREEFVAAEDSLRDALLVGGDTFKDALTLAFTRMQTKLRDLPNFQSQLPDMPKSEKDIRDVSALRAFAIDRVQKASNVSAPNIAEKRRAFVHQLVTKYSSTMPTLTEIGVEGALVTASKDASLTASPERFAETLVSSLGGTGAMKSDVVRAFAQDAKFLPALAAQTNHDATIYASLLEHVDAGRPDVFVDVVLSAQPGEPMEEAMLRATKLAGVAQAIEASAGRRGGKLQFFSSGGAKGVVGGLQKGADGILSLVGEPVREMILAEKVNGTIRNMLKGSQAFVDRLGENFVRSAFFTHVTQDLTKQLGDKTAIKGQARTVFDDLLSSIIRGPLDPSLTRATEGKVLDYYELMRANANAPKGKTFIPPGYALWDLFRLPEDHDVAGATTRRRGWLPYVGLGALGNWLGDMFSGLVDKTTSFFFTNPLVPRQLAGSRRAAAVPTRLADDMPLLVALVVVLVIVLFFVFPSSFNLTQIAHSAKSSALFAALQNAKEKLTGGAIICTGECRWPTSGTISQGPNTPDSHQGGIAQSIDIAGDCGTPVISTLQDAKVTGVHDECTDDTGYIGNSCGGGWGNYVIINGVMQVSEGQNITFSLRYSHLMQGSMPEVGTSVSLGQQIGKIDHNGSSSGCHLHYEVIGNNPEINSILPYSVPSCVGTTMCCLQMGSKCEVTP